MNVSLQNIDKVSAELTVKLEKADYQEKVDKELKTLRQRQRCRDSVKVWFLQVLLKDVWQVCNCRGSE